jgi:transcription elongation factor S-II
MDLLGRIRGGLDVKLVADMCPPPCVRTCLRAWTRCPSVSKATLRNTGAVSTMFACPKCKERNCSYTELQTRSADEGTTIFLFCHVLHTVDPGRVN